MYDSIKGVLDHFILSRHLSILNTRLSAQRLSSSQTDVGVFQLDEEGFGTCNSSYGEDVKISRSGYFIIDQGNV